MGHIVTDQEILDHLAPLVTKPFGIYRSFFAFMKVQMECYTEPSYAIDRFSNGVVHYSHPDSNGHFITFQNRVLTRYGYYGFVMVDWMLKDGDFHRLINMSREVVQTLYDLGAVDNEIKYS